jgi:hypothetical protein
MLSKEYRAEILRVEKEHRAEILRRKKVRAALKLFEKHPNYPRVAVQVADGSDILARDMSEESKTVQRPERLQHLLKILDLCAGGYCDLISDVKYHAAFIVVLDEQRRKTWEQFTGHYYDFMPMGFPLDESKQLSERIRHSTIEGYRRVASFQPVSRKVETAAPREGQDKESRRRERESIRDQYRGNFLREDLYHRHMLGGKTALS